MQAGPIHPSSQQASQPALALVRWRLDQQTILSGHGRLANSARNQVRALPVPVPSLPFLHACGKSRRVEAASIPERSLQGCRIGGHTYLLKPGRTQAEGHWTSLSRGRAGLCLLGTRPLVETRRRSCSTQSCLKTGKIALVLCPPARFTHSFSNAQNAVNPCRPDSTGEQRPDPSSGKQYTCPGSGLGRKRLAP